jgi:hypothetical protein
VLALACDDATPFARRLRHSLTGGCCGYGRLSSLKVASSLLTLAFFYDIFWVFISSSIFGKNVMVTVATGLNVPIKILVAPCPRSPSMHVISHPRLRTHREADSRLHLSRRRACAEVRKLACARA